MRPVAVVGFGALGRQIVGLLPGDDALDLVVFDDDLCRDGRGDSHPFSDLLDPRFAQHEFYVALGYRHLQLRHELIQRLAQAGRLTPSLVHPTAHVHRHAVVGPGCVVYPLSSVGENARIGRGAILQQGVTVAHDSIIGECAYLAPGVVLSGNVSVGNCAFVGAGTAVANGRRVGAAAVVGIGSVVTQDIPDGVSAIGNPLRILRRPLRLD